MNIHTPMPMPILYSFPTPKPTPWMFQSPTLVPMIQNPSSIPSHAANAYGVQETVKCRLIPPYVLPFDYNTPPIIPSNHAYHYCGNISAISSSESTISCTGSFLRSRSGEMRWSWWEGRKISGWWISLVVGRDNRQDRERREGSKGVQRRSGRGGEVEDRGCTLVPVEALGGADACDL